MRGRDVFWQERTRSTSERFRQGDFTAGIVQGIHRAANARIELQLRRTG